MAKLVIGGAVAILMSLQADCGKWKRHAPPETLRLRKVLKLPSVSQRPPILSVITIFDTNGSVTVQTDRDPQVAYRNWDKISAGHIAFPFRDKRLGYVRVEFPTSAEEGARHFVWPPLMSPAGQYIECGSRKDCLDYECPDSPDKGCEMNVYYSNGYMILTTGPHGKGIQLDSLNPFTGPDGPDGYRLFFLPNTKLSAVDNSVPIQCDMGPCRVSISIVP